MAELEKQTILKSLSNSMETSSRRRLLGVGKTTLYRKLKNYAVREQARLDKWCQPETAFTAQKVPADDGLARGFRKTYAGAH
jgi:hypothetical protein